VSGIYTTLTASIVTSGLPAGLPGATALQNVSDAVIPVPVTSGPYFFGARLYVNATIGAGQNLFAFLDGSGQPQVTFQTNINGTITAKRGSGNGTTLGTSSTGTVLTQNVASYVEFGMTCSATVGTVDVFINGAHVLALTAQNTQGQGTTNVGAVQFLGASLNGYLQDLYVCDSTGSYNNTFRGEIRVLPSHAAGPGTTAINQYTANGAASVWQSVAAVTPADSTVYSSDGTAGDRMSVTVAGTSSTNAIAALVHISRIKKTDSGARTAAQTITSQGVDAISSTLSPGTSYAYFLQVSETDPATGAPYTTTGVNQIQSGVKTVA
jgi:hypothetical protein